jgi:hypothetical protein
MGYFRRTPVRFRTILVTGLVLATLILFQAWVDHAMFSGLKGQESFNWWREAPVP